MSSTSEQPRAVQEVHFRDVDRFPSASQISHGELFALSLSNNTSYLTHGLHRFPAKFIPQIPAWAPSPRPGSLFPDLRTRIITDESGEISEADRAYLAELYPAVVLSLLDALDASERDTARLDWLSQDGNAARTNYDNAEAIAVLGTIRCVRPTLREAIDEVRACEDHLAASPASPASPGATRE